jgi:hypothetical protein
MSTLVNFWAVGASMILSLVLGFIWYGPLFGKPWMKMSGIAMSDKKPSMASMTKPMILALIGAFLLSSTLSFSIAFHDAYFQVTGYAAALSLAFVLWLGLMVPPYLNLTGWEGKPWKLFAINTGYWLVFLLLSASIIVLLG